MALNEYYRNEALALGVLGGLAMGSLGTIGGLAFGSGYAHRRSYYREKSQSMQLDFGGYGLFDFNMFGQENKNKSKNLVGKTKYSYNSVINGQNMGSMNLDAAMSLASKRALEYASIWSQNFTTERQSYMTQDQLSAIQRGEII